MGPYSHIVIASELETYIKPNKSQEYYWGAIAPDIRYLVIGMDRGQTHISSEKIMDYIVQYPQLKSFLQGYLVHCLSDELDLPQIIQKKFPFILQKNELSSQLCSVILEFYNNACVKPVRKSLSGANNLVLSELGISDEHTTIFAQEIKRYITSPSFVSSVVLFQNLGFAGDGQVEKYWIAAQRFQRNWLQKNLVLLGLKVGKVGEEITSSVRSIFPTM